MKRALADMAGWSEWLGGAPPRLLQGHSPSGEPRCTDLVEKLRGSGESPVNNSGLDQPRLTWDAEIDRKANSLSCHTGIPESIRQSLLCSRPGRPPSLNPVAEDHQKHDKPEPQFRRIGIEQNDQQNKFRNQPGKFLTQERTECHEKVRTSLRGSRLTQEGQIPDAIDAECAEPTGERTQSRDDVSHR